MSQESNMDCYVIIKDLSRMDETIIQNEGSTLYLGRRGENAIKQIEFNIGKWKRNLGDGSVSLLVRRPGESETYKVNLKVEGDLAIWPILRIDTATDGMGIAQLTYAVNEQVAKTALYSTCIEKGLDNSNTIIPASAYEIAVSHGYQGTEEEWIESLNGKDGESAFDLWKKQDGNIEKTETDFLESLKGNKGDDGATITSITLTKGEDGVITGGKAKLSNGKDVNITVK